MGYLSLMSLCDLCNSRLDAYYHSYRAQCPVNSDHWADFCYDCWVYFEQPFDFWCEGCCQIQTVKQTPRDWVCIELVQDLSLLKYT